MDTYSKLSSQLSHSSHSFILLYFLIILFLSVSGKLPHGQGQGLVQDQRQNQGQGTIFLGGNFPRTFHYKWYEIKRKIQTRLFGLIKLFFFLQTFCFTIELLALQANNIKLCRSRRYCTCLTQFGSIFPFKPLKK